LEAFSDGVFAIAITLLVLEFGVDTATHDLGSQLLHIWPSYLAYVTSFLTIGVIWVNHHALFDFVGRVDRALLFLNSLLLMVVAFTPFPTRLIAGFLRQGGNEETAALAVESADAAPTADALAGWSHHHQEVIDALAAWRELLESGLPRLNRSLKSAGLSPLTRE